MFPTCVNPVGDRAQTKGFPKLRASVESLNGVAVRAALLGEALLMLPTTAGSLVPTEVCALGQVQDSPRVLHPNEL